MSTTQGKDDFTAVLNLGTGHNGTPRVSHTTLLQRLITMRDSGDWSFSLQGKLPRLALFQGLQKTDHSCVRVCACVPSAVVQRSGFLWRNRQLLFEIPMSASQLVNAHNSANHRRTLV
jgi:hypothetical protein